MIAVSIQWYINDTVYHRSAISSATTYEGTYELIQQYMQRVYPGVAYTVHMTDGVTYMHEQYTGIQATSRKPIKQDTPQNWRYN